jgi:catechol 2,3-dioxygenase-like lactoylglutathione lyase family enzyme
MNLNVSDVKVFVPAKDFELSLSFYEALGWRVNFRAEDDGIAVLELADCRFYLQNYYQKDWADNFMLHVTVADAQAWWEHAKGVIENGDFGGARVKKPVEESYGALVTHVWDPAGVLLHFAEFH